MASKKNNSQNKPAAAPEEAVKAELKGSWVTYPTEANESGRTVIVSVRTDIAEFRSNPRFKYRVSVTLPYETAGEAAQDQSTEDTPGAHLHADATGMPDEKTSQLLEDVTLALATVFRKDPVAVLTEMSTGDGERQWDFYTLSLHIFQRKFNEALVQLPVLPFEFAAEDDPAWSSYFAPADEE